MKPQTRTPQQTNSRDAPVALRKAEEISQPTADKIRFRTIADSMPESICFVDAQQCYQYCNKTYETTFGIPPEKLKGRPVRDVLGEAIYPVVRPYIEKVLGGEATSYEGYILHKKIGRRYEHVDYLPQEDKNGKVEGFYAIVRNLTELKEAEEKFRAFVESVPQAIIIHDTHGKIALVSFEAEHVFGYSRNELIGQSFEVLMPRCLRKNYVSAWHAYIRKPVMGPIGHGSEFYGLRKDGSEFPAEIRLRSVETVNGSFVASTFVDITERKRSDERQRLATVLQERARVARDLHDTLAQGLTGIIMNLEAAKEASAYRAKEETLRLEQAEGVARENLGQIRRSLKELSAPSTRRVTNLPESLRELVRSLSTEKTEIRFSLRGTPQRLHGDAQENLLFIAQQATDNAVLHAHANTVHIRLGFGRKSVELQVQDDGHGFNVKAVKHGLGLTSMRDRAELIGGHFALHSRSGKGTSVEVNVPFTAEQLPKIRT